MDEFRKALQALNQQDKEPEEVVEEYDDEETLDEKMKRLAEEVCIHVCMNTRKSHVSLRNYPVP